MSKLLTYSSSRTFRVGAQHPSPPPPLSPFAGALQQPTEARLRPQTASRPGAAEQRGQRRPVHPAPDPACSPQAPRLGPRPGQPGVTWPGAPAEPAGEASPAPPTFPQRFSPPWGRFRALASRCEMRIAFKSHAEKGVKGDRTLEERPETPSSAHPSGRVPWVLPWGDGGEQSRRCFPGCRGRRGGPCSLPPPSRCLQVALASPPRD